MSFCYPEQFRILKGDVASTTGEDGAFWIPAEPGDADPLQAHASVAIGWEHVAVVPSIAKRCPTWPEMVYVKGLFWDPADCVLQFHPPRSEYINHHPYCLHLWRPTRALIVQDEETLRALWRMGLPSRIEREWRPDTLELPRSPTRQALERRGHAAAADARRREYVVMVKALSDLGRGALQERRRLGASRTC